MPDFPAPGAAPRTTSYSYTVNLLAAGGDDSSVQIADIPTSATGGEIAAVRTAIGNLSNAAVFSTSYTEKVQIATKNVNPLDETYSAAATKMTLVFQDDDLNERTFAIPAPDASYFGSDGVTVITPDGAAAAGTPAKLLADSIAAIALVINGGAAGAGTYAYLKGYRSQNARKLPKPRNVRPVVEPGAGVEPGDEPGV